MSRAARAFGDSSSLVSNTSHVNPSAAASDWNDSALSRDHAIRFWYGSNWNSTAASDFGKFDDSSRSAVRATASSSTQTHG